MYRRPEEIGHYHLTRRKGKKERRENKKDELKNFAVD
jgi:hypothetical protein